MSPVHLRRVHPAHRDSDASAPPPVAPLSYPVPVGARGPKPSVTLLRCRNPYCGAWLTARARELGECQDCHTPMREDAR